MMGCGGESVGDIVPADHAGMKQPLCHHAVLPTGASISELSNKTRGVAGDEVQIAELRGHALLYLVQGAKNGDGMNVEF